MFVRNHMTRQPLTVNPETPVRRVMELMTGPQVRHLPVIDASGRLVGMISDRELRRACTSDAASNVRDLPAGEIMAREPMAVAADAPLCSALALLCEHGADALPVLEDEHVVGVLTRFDFLQVMYRLLGLDQEGSCVELALEDPVEDMAIAVDVLRERGVRLLSAVASCVRDDGDDTALYLRVDARNPRSLESALARRGLILLVPENETGSEQRSRATNTPAAGSAPGTEPHAGHPVRRREPQDASRVASRSAAANATSEAPVVRRAPSPHQKH